MKGNRLFVLFLCIVLAALESCKQNTNNNFQSPSEKGQGILNLTTRACYFADADSIQKQTQIKIDVPSTREVEQITSIMEYTGLPQNFKIFRGDIDNALATIVNNQRLIIYNKDLFSVMDKMSSSYWTSMFIIAHEIGHHLAFNISDTSNLLNAELEADKFAAFILFKMGADSNQVTDAVASSLISITQDSKTHPSKSKRTEVVKKSWQQSYYLRFLSAIPPQIHDQYSLAVGKPFDKNPERNNLNGFPPRYNPTGYNDYQLIFNNWALSKLDSNSVPLEYNSQGSDSSIYQIFPNISRNYHGIIVDVQKRTLLPEFNNCVLLEIGILITKIDANYNYAALSVNQRYQFLVCFSPRGFTQDILSYTNFFSGGRRLEFDILDLNKEVEMNGLFYISRAYSL